MLRLTDDLLPDVLTAPEDNLYDGSFKGSLLKGFALLHFFSKASLAICLVDTLQLRFNQSSLGQVGRKIIQTAF